MIIFGLLAAAMVVVAVALVAWPMYQNRVKQGPAREAINVALYRDRLAELEAERDSGALAPDQFAQTQLELQRDLLENAVPDTVSEQGVRQPRAALALGVLVPALAAGLYVWLGAPDFIGRETAPQHGQGGNMMSMEEAITRLRKRLADNPNDRDGWMLLGRSLVSQKQFGAAADTYAQALTHLGEEPELLGLYAEALAMAQGGMDGRPDELAKRALELDPNAVIALWLTGYGARERGDFAGAAKRWERLAGVLPPDNPLLKMVQENLADARRRAGMPAAVAAKATPAGPGPKIKVSVGVDDSLRSRLSPDAVLFVYAQDPAGGRMPVAIVRRAATVPVEVTLDQSKVMMPGRQLSNYKALKIVARVSRSGAAMPSSGDLYGEARWALGEKKVAVSIDHSIP